MWVSAYTGHRQGLQPWPQLLEALHQAPLAPQRDALGAALAAMLTRELARDPELEELPSASHLVDMAEELLLAALPWYGGEVLSITNTCLTGWSPADRFLVQEEGESPVPASVEAILSALETLPGHLLALEQAYAPARAAVLAGDSTVPAVEAVLDLVIAATGCRPAWHRTLFAAFLWLHEAVGVPLPESRRAAMLDWLAQSCVEGLPPEPRTRAELLSGLARTLRRTSRW